MTNRFCIDDYGLPVLLWGAYLVQLGEVHAAKEIDVERASLLDRGIRRLRARRHFSS